MAITKSKIQLKLPNAMRWKGIIPRGFKAKMILPIASLSRPNARFLKTRGWWDTDHAGVPLADGTSTGDILKCTLNKLQLAQLF